MKILFLVPPETLSLESSVPKALEGGKGYYPKLGLLYVAGWYERATGNRPTFIMKQISKVRSWEDFTAKARMGTKILTSRLGV
jgi:hypothetical protein